MLVKKLCNIALVAVFALGVLLAPAIHKANCFYEDCHTGPADSNDCHHPPEKHDSSCCALCQLASTPVIAVPPAAVPVASGDAMENALLASIPSVFRADQLLPFSCGPPA